MGSPGVADVVLALEQVRFRYRGAAAWALEGVSLAVRAGEGVALIGANGAGKTTLLRLAMALERPTSGRVTSAGIDTTGRGPEDLAPRVGFLFQQAESQLFERTVRAELGFGPRQLGWDGTRVGGAVESVLDELGLGPVAERHPYDLPAPARRLVALAAALVASPRLLLLDEPTAGLDRATRRIVEGAMRRRREQGVAVMAVTHDGGFAIETLDRAVTLQRGQVLGDGPLADALAAADAPLALPPQAELARRLGLSVASERFEDVVRGLIAQEIARERC